MGLDSQSRLSDVPFVDKIWRMQTERASGGSFISAAASQWEMVVTTYEGTTTFSIRGPETKASPAPMPQKAEFLGIIFKLGTFMPPLPTKDRVNNDMHLPEASGQNFWLHGSAWQFPNFENADTFLNRLIRDGLLVHDPIIEAALQGEANDMSLRSIQRRFLQVTGLTQKRIQQIERARQAQTLLQQGESILDTAFQLGYFDQAHLTNSLKHYIGQTPAQILRQTQAE